MKVFDFFLNASCANRAQLSEGNECNTLNLMQSNLYVFDHYSNTVCTVLLYNALVIL